MNDHTYADTCGCYWCAAVRQLNREKTALSERVCSLQRDNEAAATNALALLNENARLRKELKGIADIGCHHCSGDASEALQSRQDRHARAAEFLDASDERKSQLIKEEADAMAGREPTAQVDNVPPKDTSFWGTLSDQGRQQEYERVLKENIRLKGAVRDLKEHSGEV